MHIGQIGFEGARWDYLTTESTFVSSNNTTSSVGCAIICWTLGLGIESSHRHVFFASNMIGGPERTGGLSSPGMDELYSPTTDETSIDG